MGDARTGGVGFDRRTMLKTAVGAGAAAVAWTAPHIETLGFAPAGAAHFGSLCVILSPETDDKHSNDDNNAYCSTPGTPATTNCCGQAFGDQGKFDIWTFENPTPLCSEVVVQSVPLDCNQDEPNGNVPKPKNPDVGQFAVLITSTTGTCNCTIFDAVLLDSRQRTPLKELNNGPSDCDFGFGPGVDASIPCDEPLLASDARLAVRITCQAGVGCT